MKEIKKVEKIIGHLPILFNQRIVFYLASLGNIQTGVSNDLRYNLIIIEQQINKLIIENNLEDDFKKLQEANGIEEVTQLRGAINMMGNAKLISYIGKQANYQTLAINGMHIVLKNQITALEQLQRMLSIEGDNSSYEHMKDLPMLSGSVRLLFNRKDVKVIGDLKNHQSKALNTINDNITTLANKIDYIREKDKNIKR